MKGGGGGGGQRYWVTEKGREIDYREVAPPGQDSCQPGPDMTSAEGEAGRHSQWWGVVRVWHQGAVQRGASSIAVHARLWLLSTLTSGQLSLSLSSRDAPLYLSFATLTDRLSHYLQDQFGLKKKKILPSKVCFWECVSSGMVQESFLNPYPARINVQILKA